MTVDSGRCNTILNRPNTYYIRCGVERLLNCGIHSGNSAATYIYFSKHKYYQHNNYIYAIEIMKVTICLCMAGINQNIVCSESIDLLKIIHIDYRSSFEDA